jgi:cadmium resistance protein CadD (predicted permease)
MEKFFTGIALIIAIPISLGISWLAGMLFRTAVLKHDLEKGNKYLQLVITIAIGIFILLIIGTFTDKMGCSSDDDMYTRP